MSQAFYNFTKRKASIETKNIILNKLQSRKHSPSKLKLASEAKPTLATNENFGEKSEHIQIAGMSEVLEVPDSEHRQE